MKAQLLKSGNYRVRITQDKVTYSLTFDHIPSDKEVYKALNKKLQECPDATHKPHLGTSFAQAVKDYIELKKDRNSPATLREYERLPNHFSERFCNMEISKITQLDVDREIANWLKSNLSFKTMSNYIHMAQAVISKFGGATFSLDMLPEKPKKDEPYIPTPEDVSRILEHFKATSSKNLIPFWLSIYGFRRGEILALDISDIDFETATVSVTKDMVEDAGKNWVIKEPKTQASRREVAISRDLSELIRITGKIYDGHPNSLNKALRRAQKTLGIECFSWHKMRHFCCSQLFDLNYNETDIMAVMGWAEESDCMRQVYKHALIKKDKDRLRRLADNLTSRIDTSLTQK